MLRSLMNAGRVFVVQAATVLALLQPAFAADPDALWKIVHGQCVPDQQANGRPAPCVAVSLEGGYAVLKDIVGASQFLLIPTARITGIESPAVLEAATPNYFAAAWAARSWVETALHRSLPREDIGLAINAASARSQNQLHIHIDCLRPDVVDTLRRHADAIGENWSRLPVPLGRHAYLARRLDEAALAADSPFRLLAAGVPAAGADMADQTLVVAGMTFGGDKAGFVLLDGHVDLLAGDLAHGEDLLDHDCSVAK